MNSGGDKGLEITEISRESKVIKEERFKKSKGIGS
jgi:hypothetical protein